MPLVCKIILILVIVSANILLGPPIVSYFFIFSRRNSLKLMDADIEKTYLGPYKDILYESYDYVSAYDKKELSLTARDGSILKAEYYDEGNDKVIILFHGYRGSQFINFPYHIRFFLNNGYNVIAAYNRAHDKSGGKHSTLGYLEKFDVVDWTEYAHDDLKFENVALYGISMGGASVAMSSDLLDPSFVKVLVVDCGFSCGYHQIKSDCKKFHLPWFSYAPIMTGLAKLFLKADCRETAGEHLSKTTLPVFFFHGTADRTVFPDETETNFNACNSTKDKMIIEGANHTLSLIKGGKEAEERLLGFLNIYI